MNIFDARVEGGIVKMGDASIGPAHIPDRQVKLGLRPEHLVTDEAGPIEAHIQMSEPLGANTLLHGRLSNSADVITASLAGVHAISDKGATWRFSVDPGHIHLFDPATGHRLET